MVLLRLRPEEHTNLQPDLSQVHDDLLHVYFCTHGAAGCFSCLLSRCLYILLVIGLAVLGCIVSIVAD